VDRRSRAGEVVDLVDLDVERERDVVAKELEIAMCEQRSDVPATSGKEIVDAEDLVPSVEQ
jgi:hypothetical protein